MAWKNKEDEKEYRKIYDSEHRDYINERRRKYYRTAEGHEKLKVCKRNWARKESSKKRHTAWRLKNQYGITVCEYENMLTAQNNSCVLCGINFNNTSQGPCIDHDHNSHVVRGLLCSKCNWALGLFYDDIVRLQKAIDYLVKNN